MFLISWVSFLTSYVGSTLKSGGLVGPKTALEVLEYKLISCRDCAKCADSFAVSLFTNISDGKVQITTLILSDEEP